MQWNSLRHPQSRFSTTVPQPHLFLCTKPGPAPVSFRAPSRQTPPYGVLKTYSIPRPNAITSQANPPLTPRHHVPKQPHAQPSKSPTRKECSLPRRTPPSYVPPPPPHQFDGPSSLPRRAPAREMDETDVRGPPADTVTLDRWEHRVRLDEVVVTVTKGSRVSLAYEHDAVARCRMVCCISTCLITGTCAVRSTRVGKNRAVTGLPRGSRRRARPWYDAKFVPVLGLRRGGDSHRRLADHAALASGGPARALHQTPLARCRQTPGEETRRSRLRLHLTHPPTTPASPLRTALTTSRRRDSPGACASHSSSPRTFSSRDAVVR